MAAYDIVVRFKKNNSKFWNVIKNIFLKVESNISENTEVIFKFYF